MKNSYEESLDHLETQKRENKNLQREFNDVVVVPHLGLLLLCPLSCLFLVFCSSKMAVRGSSNIRKLFMFNK